MAMHMMIRWSGFLGILLVLSSSVMAAETDTRGQRLEYDPDAGRWIEQAPPVPGTPTGDLQLVRQAFARQEHRRAQRGVKRWLQQYGPEDPLYPEALLLRAEIEVARGDYYKAHEHLQEFLAEFGDTPLAERAAHFEFVIAENFLIAGKRRKWLGMRLLNSTDTGIEILDEVAGTYPDSVLAQQAIMTKAEHYYNENDYLLAELEYSHLVEQYPRSQWYRFALRRTADAALAGFGGVQFDDAPLIEAEDRYTHYLSQYPGSGEQEGIGQILQQVHADRAMKELSIGQYYERTGHFGSARFYYRSTCDNWPDTIAGAEARARLEALAAEATEQEAAELAEPEPQATEPAPAESAPIEPPDDSTPAQKSLEQIPIEQVPIDTAPPTEPEP